MAKPRVQVPAISPSETAVIKAIVARALIWFPDRTERDILMDMTAVQLTVPLRLNDLLDADDTNFVHDICGIERHLNRQTFELEGCFVPRFAERRI